MGSWVLLLPWIADFSTYRSYAVSIPLLENALRRGFNESQGVDEMRFLVEHFERRMKVLSRGNKNLKSYYLLQCHPASVLTKENYRGKLVIMSN